MNWEKTGVLNSTQGECKRIFDPLVYSKISLQETEIRQSITDLESCYRQQPACLILWISFVQKISTLISFLKTKAFR